MDYRINIRKDSNGTYLATFPDLPGVQTFGDTREEALERANDAFLTGVAAHDSDTPRGVRASGDWRYSTSCVSLGGVKDCSSQPDGSREGQPRRTKPTP